MSDDTGNPNFALLEALRGRDTATAERLIETLRQVNYIDSRGMSALMVAAYRGYAALCEKLLAKGADVLHFVETLDQDGNVSAADDVLDRAKCSGDPRTLQVIEPAWLRARWARAAGARISDPVTFQQSGWECLLDAARLGMADLCADMIVAGVPLKHKHPRYEGNTPLQLAADYGQLRTCALLVALGADSAYLSPHENIPSELAQALDAVGRLLRNPDSVSLRD